MALPAHVDRDLVASILAMAGLPQADIERALSRGNDPAVIWDTVMGRKYPDDVRKRLELAGKYMETLSGGDLRKLLIEGHNLPESVVDRAIRSSSSGDTIAQVLQRIATDNTQYVNRTHTRQTIAGILGTTETLGVQGLNKSKQDYMSPNQQAAISAGNQVLGAAQSVIRNLPRPGGGRTPTDPVTLAATAGLPDLSGRGGGGEIPAVMPKDKAGIMNVQRLLNERGANLVVDGINGPKTQAAHQQYGAGKITHPAPGGETLGSMFPDGDGSGNTNVNAPVAAPGRLETEWAKINPADDAAVEAFIRREFGFAAWALEVPEVRRVLVDFARDMAGQPFSEAQLEARLLGTEWWRTKTGKQRERIKERNEDPATYNANVLGMLDQVRNIANSQGVGFNIPEERLNEIARTAYEQGWTSGEVRSALAAEFDYDPATGGQAASAVVGNLKQLASNYLVPLSEATIDEWGRKLIAGTATNETVEGYLREQAKQLLPTFATQIDAGLTPQSLVEPYRQTIARELDMDPSQVDFIEGKWNRFINAMDPKTNAPRTMSFWEIQRTIRTDPTYRWDETKTARSEASEFATQMAQRFGRAG